MKITCFEDFDRQYTKGYRQEAITYRPLPIAYSPLPLALEILACLKYKGDLRTDEERDGFYSCKLLYHIRTTYL